MEKKSSNGLVSVIIPNFNRKSELVRAINSVVDQIYENLEILVIDDHSDFSNEAYLAQQGVLNHNIRVIRNSENKGLSYTRNVGIRAAQGEWIALLDSDDFWEPQKIEKQVQLFCENPSLDMVYCDTFLIMKDKQVPRNTTFINTDLWSHLLKGWKPPNPSTLMMKKSCFDKIGYFDERLRYLEDLDFWLRAAGNLEVGFCTDQLSNFSFDSEDRLSYTHKPKFERNSVFLHKWAKEISDREGSEVFSHFKNDLLFRMATETFIGSFKQKKFYNMIDVYFRYLLWDKAFYQMLLKKIKRKLLGKDT